jgi:hypothetical protein
MQYSLALRVAKTYFVKFVRSAAMECLLSPQYHHGEHVFHLAHVSWYP